VVFNIPYLIFARCRGFKSALKRLSSVTKTKFRLSNVTGRQFNRADFVRSGQSVTRVTEHFDSVTASIF